jgi:hypothetical protein
MQTSTALTSRAPELAYARIWKPCIDRIFSVLLIIMMAPLMTMLALIIRIKLGPWNCEPTSTSNTSGRFPRSWTLGLCLPPPQHSSQNEVTEEVPKSDNHGGG